MLHTFLHIKEDAHTLYGFSDPFEKFMFVSMISVSGIGPNTARMVLSSLSPREAQQAILSDNVKLIQSVKGIGPKSAKRLILELKDKLGKKIDEFDVSVAVSHNRIHEEALSALANLGFSRLASEKALSQAEQAAPESSVEDLIKLLIGCVYKIASTFESAKLFV